MFLWTRPQGTAAATAGGNSGELPTDRCKAAALDVNVSALTGGTAPTIQFFVDRLANDGIWYEAASTAAISAVGNVSLDIAESVADSTGIQHMVFTNRCRVRWVFAGTVVADSIAFSGSLYGRS